MSIPINIDPLSKAVHRLEEGLHRYLQDVSDIQIRDGLVQRFEFTYELSYKMLKRYLELTSANPAAFDQMAFADLVHSANEQGLLSREWSVWKNFREMRGSTSHAYDETIAMKVVGGIPDFLREAKFLLAQLQKRIL
jgi:nucleotidyltransferase substrate binding protein (TIGR01987 family)